MALIHILDHNTDEIIGTLNSDKGEFTNAERTTRKDNKNTLDFIALKKFDLLTKKNRLLLLNRDGFLDEYIIGETDQYKRNQKIVESDASFVELASDNKIIPPGVWEGQTAQTATETTLNGTGWKSGIIEFSGSRTINIDTFKDPLAMLNLIASTFGLKLRFRVEDRGNKIAGRYVDLIQSRPIFEGKEIVFGKDLIGIRRKENDRNIVTGLVGIGPEKDDGTRLNVTVKDKEAYQRWNRQGRHIIRVYEPETTDQNMTLERLTELTKNELKKRIESVVSYECEAVALENVLGLEHEKIRIDRIVRIKDTKYDPPIYLEAEFDEIKDNPATKDILGFKIGDFIEFRREDLENQIKALKGMLAQKPSKTYVDNADNSVKVEANQYTDQLKDGLGSGTVPISPESIAGMIDAGKIDVSLTIDSTIPFAADSNVFYGSGPYFMTDARDDRNYHRAVVLSFVHDKRYVFIRVYGNWTSIDPAGDPVLDGSCQFIISTSKDPADAIPGGSGQFTEKAPTEGARTLVLDMGEPTKQIKDIHVLFRAGGSKTSTGYPGANLRLGYKGQND